MYQFALVDNPWRSTNIINNHAPLGALYPPLKYITEGDTPSWINPRSLANFLTGGTSRSPASP